MEKEQELKQVNMDIIFFFLTLIAAFISFYLINEKKKSIFNKQTISNKQANNIYKFNRHLLFFIECYFLINSYYYYKKLKNQQFKNEEDYNQAKLLFLANIFSFISVIIYLPLGNSNLIIEN